MKNLKFFTKNEKTEKLEIDNSKVLDFLADAGYGYAEGGGMSFLVHNKDQRLRIVDISELTRDRFDRGKGDKTKCDAISDRVCQRRK